MLMQVNRHLMLVIVMLGAVCILTSVTTASVPFGQASAQMEHMQNSNAATKMRVRVFDVYENPTLGIKFQHPRDWPVLTQKIGQTTVIKLNSTRQSDMDIIPPTISISIGNLPQNGKTLDNLTRVNMAQAANTTGFHLNESNLTKLGGILAKRIIYTYRSDDPVLTLPLTSMDIWTVKDGKKYTFSYIDAQSEFTKQLPIVNKILKSFEIK